MPWRVAVILLLVAAGLGAQPAWAADDVVVAEGDVGEVAVRGDTVVTRSGRTATVLVGGQVARTLPADAVDAGTDAAGRAVFAVARCGARCAVTLLSSAGRTVQRVTLPGKWIEDVAIGRGVIAWVTEDGVLRSRRAARGGRVRREARWWPTSGPFHIDTDGRSIVASGTEDLEPEGDSFDTISSVVVATRIGSGRAQEVARSFRARLGQPVLRGDRVDVLFRAGTIASYALPNRRDGKPGRARLRATGFDVIAWDTDGRRAALVESPSAGLSCELGAVDTIDSIGDRSGIPVPCRVVVARLGTQRRLPPRLVRAGRRLVLRRTVLKPTGGRLRDDPVAGIEVQFFPVTGKPEVGALMGTGTTGADGRVALPETPEDTTALAIAQTTPKAYALPDGVPASLD